MQIFPLPTLFAISRNIAVVSKHLAVFVLLYVRQFYRHGEIITEDKQEMMREKRKHKIILLGAVDSTKLHVIANLQAKFNISISRT
jgi:hypothetical protein